MLLQTSKAQKSADNKYVSDGGSIVGLIASAASGLAARVEARYTLVSSDSQDGSKPGVIFIVGSGNNGNDGLSAAAMLARKGIGVKIFKPDSFKKANDAVTAALEADLSSLGIEVLTLSEEAMFQNDFAGMVRESACVVDCVFGTGYDPGREPPSVVKKLIDIVNANSPCTISADIPSGVSADTGECGVPSIKANETVTFGAPKPGQYILPGKAHTGLLTVSPILIKDGLTGTDAPVCLTKSDAKYVSSLLPKRDPYGSKYSNGRVLVIAGSKQFAGAAVLAVSSALRGGAGLVTSAVPGSIVSDVTAACPEAVRLPLGGTTVSTLGPKHLDMLLDAAKIADAVVIGPGLGRTPGTVKTVIDFLKNNSCRKLVIDADALFALAVYSSLSSGDSGNVFALKYAKYFTAKELSVSFESMFSDKEVILTPHAGEAARLLGLPSAEIDLKRLYYAKEISRKYSAVALLKGNDTLICAPSGAYTVNSVGNTALSKGGSGDVLAGLIGSLLGSGMNAYDAARAGAFIHGAAAEILSEEMTERCVLPGDLPLAFRKLM
ncbi:MAG: NAD(P)H-hydrate dehydratase [Clostridia bacterium]|nr:NAD(P)H-hydrate dehydratase [Clostridia bacterium]